jgi:nucleoside-diphosphate-sugar epimerase
MQTRVLLIGCGDIALRVARRLRGRCKLLGTARRAERFPALRAAGIVPLAADLDRRDGLRRLAGLARIIIHLAPPPDAGGTDGRTRRLLAALSRSAPAARLVYISTSGVYGDCGGARIAETRALHPETARAKRRADAERRIRAWAARNRACASILRVPGIYAGDRLPLERLRAGTPAIAATEDSYTNHIHADDLAQVIVAAMRRGRPNRTYHACDDSEMKMGDYFDAVADAFGLARPPRLPRAEVQSSVSPALWSFMNESRRLDNTRMKRELKVRLTYPTVGDGLKAARADKTRSPL